MRGKYCWLADKPSQIQPVEQADDFRCKSTFSYSRATNARVGLAVGRQGGTSPLSPLVLWSPPKAPFKIFCHGCLEEERLEVEDDDKLATLTP